jgi:ATP-dependent Clp protease ATP-binding subunit ClpA
MYEIAPSALLAWRIANKVAIYAGSEKIEPVHLFISILQMLEGFYLSDAEELGLSDEQLAKLAAEIDDCLLGLSKSQADVTKIRRSIRRNIPYAMTHSLRSHLLHRSSATKKIFEESSKVQKSSDNKIITFLSLATLTMSMYEDGRFSNEQLRLGRSENGIDESNAWKSSGLIYSMGRSLTELAQEGKLAPVMGREKEMISIARIINRTSKRNVLLIGEAGVGKTAIVEGLAQRLTNENTVESLRGLKIIQINVADLVSGTAYRGEMEKRLQQLLDEVGQDPSMLLFLDEIHLVMKSGAVGNSGMDIASLLKPALARDDFRCVGATTVEDYERYIKDDKAFMRRFQVIHVKEPDHETMVKICSAWARRIEQKHFVLFQDEAIQEAIQASTRYLPDRRLPDKAIDLLENAAVCKRISTLDFNKDVQNPDSYIITADDIDKIISDNFGIPTGPLEEIRIREIREYLLGKVIGQEGPIEDIIHYLEYSQTGDTQNKVMGTLFFYGPSGVGKTYSAECLAYALFNKPGFIVSYQMSEYRERYDLAKLIGAAPGLIGHDTEGPLFRFMDMHSQGMILLHDFERAHPDVQDYFCSIFNYGEARDSKGRLVNFRNYYFVLISHDIDGLETISKDFDPRIAEMIHQLDVTIRFNSIPLESYQEIFQQQIIGIEQKLRNEIRLRVDDVSCLNIVLDMHGRSGKVFQFIRLIDREIKQPILRLHKQHPDKNDFSLIWQNQKLVII